MPNLNLITDIPGISVGHATDPALGSGVTSIVFARPAVAAVLTLGGAPGTRGTDLLEPENLIETVDAVVLAGGSVFGLEASAGAEAALREAGRGVVFGGFAIPIVAQAILFDLTNGGDKDWGRFSPYRDLGYAATMAAAGGAFALGSAGAGTGATTSTLKGGIGSASAVTRGGHTVGAIVAVNAVGTATIGDGPHFWAAPFEEGAEFGGLGSPARLSTSDLAPRLKGVRSATGTTIGLVATDAALTTPQAARLAIMANDGLARAVFPAHAPTDGDTVFAAATGDRALADPVHDLTELGHVAAIVFARAIARGVYAATALPFPGALPAWRDRFGGQVGGGRSA